MSRRGIILLMYFSFLLMSGALSASNQGLINQYLDSCTKYLNKGRADLVVQFNLKADVLAQKEEGLPYVLNYKIQNNYVWAFNEINQQELKNYHLKKLIQLVDAERESRKNAFGLYIIGLGKLSGLYNSLNQLDSAKKYYELAITVAEEYNDSLHIAGTKNNMGLFMVRYKGWEEARPYFNEALTWLTIQNDQDSVLYCSIRDNLADYYFYKGDSLIGLEIVENNLQFLSPNKKTVEKLMRWGRKVLPYYIAKGEIAKARGLVKNLEQILTLGKGKWKFENKKSLFESKVTIERVAGNKEGLDRILKEQTAFLEEYVIFLKENNLSINQLLSEYQAYTISEELKAVEEEIDQAKKENRRNVLFLLAALLISIIILFLIRTNYQRKIRIESGQRLLKAKELQIAQLEKEKIHSELESKSSDFSQLLMQSALQEDWSKYLIERLQEIKSSMDDEGKQQFNKLILELKQKGSMYEKLHDLQKGMEEANTHFFKSLESQFPALTKAEKDTCGLIRINMQSKEIALIRNISPSSVRKLRQRIRGKLGLELEEDLYAFIQGI